MAKNKKVSIALTGSSDGLDAALKKASKSVKDFAKNSQGDLDNVKPKGFMDKLMAGAKEAQMDKRKSGEAALERIAGRGIGGMAEFGLDAVGLGVVGLGVGIVGEQVNQFSEQMLKLKNGEATPADLAKGFMEGLPVLGSWVKASENLFEYFTGCRMETAEMVKNHEKMSQAISSQTQAAKGSYFGAMDPALGTAFSAHGKALAAYQAIDKEQEEMRKAKIKPSKQDERNWDERRFAAQSEEKLTTSDAWRKYELDKNKSTLALSQEFAQQKLTIEKNGAKSAGALWKVQEKEITAGFNAKYDQMDAEAINLRAKIKDIDEQLLVSDPNADSTKRLKQVRDDMDKQQLDMQRNMNGLRAVNQSNIDAQGEAFAQKVRADRRNISGGELGMSSSLISQLQGLPGGNSPQAQRMQKLLGAYSFNQQFSGQIEGILNSTTASEAQKKGAKGLQNSLSLVTEMMTNEKSLTMGQYIPLRFAQAEEGGGRYSGAAEVAMSKDSPSDSNEKEMVKLLGQINDNLGNMLGQRGQGEPVFANK